MTWKVWRVCVNVEVDALALSVHVISNDIVKHEKNIKTVLLKALQLLQRFIQSTDVGILVTYNGSSCDLPYIAAVLLFSRILSSQSIFMLR